MIQYQTHARGRQYGGGGNVNCEVSEVIFFMVQPNVANVNYVRFFYDV